ncbi:MAG: NAD(P)/FAD-dependent oxidoreductase [Clostridia bacterium]|nr:NAD(P)/FAD-dependent oxidoreductase [Clostridia bacterium]
MIITQEYDVLIIGAGTSGAHLAKAVASKGWSVLVIEKLPREKTGTKYDIFHIEEREFARLGIPRPQKGEPGWAFEFEKNYNADPRTLYPKLQTNPIVGLHMHEYTLLLCDLAEKAGAEIMFETAFEAFTSDSYGKISGVTAVKNGETLSIKAKIVVDCSGIGAAARTSLPDTCVIDNKPLGDDDMFYVILRYVKIKNAKDYLDGSTFWAYYKSWIAPCADPEGAIIGIGACHSYEYAEKIYEEMEKTVPLPEYELVKIEKGRTPFTKSPYSLVTDNFIVSGDAGCLTKSVNGEGVTSSIYMLNIAADCIDRAFKIGDTSKETLWKINTEYNRTQGAEFAFLRALLTGVVNAADFNEFEYVFKENIINDELLNALNGSAVPAKVLIKAVANFVKGIVTKNIRLSTVKAAADAFKNAVDISSHYKKFPDSPEDFNEWRKTADNIYSKIGKIQ